MLTRTFKATTSNLFKLHARTMMSQTPKSDQTNLGEFHKNSAEPLQLWQTDNRAGYILTVDDKPGRLANILQVMAQHGLNLTSIQSKPPKYFSGKKTMNFHVDFEGTFADGNVRKCADTLRSVHNVELTELGTALVPWFPTKIEDFDFIGKRILSEGDGIQDADHPGFRDPEYKARRKEITDLALGYKYGQPIARVTYTETEKAVWKMCYERLKTLFATNACQEFNWTVAEFEKEVPNFGANEIPQLEDISQFLQSKTGWRLKPVGGLLTQREFLNGLAFKIFHSTQYIRHHSQPLYTPEPDIVHELMGHAPMFAHQDFSDFSQEIGLASLGASELDIQKLAAIYWFTIEFGMCLENGQKKAYGAGILSSMGELEYCVTDKPKFKPFRPHDIAQNHLEFPISSMQPIYFLAESFQNAKAQIINYCNEHVVRPFQLTYNRDKHTVEVDRSVKTRPDAADGPLF